MKLTNQDFLLRWGWNNYFEQQVLEVNSDMTSWVLGRVSGEERDRWRVQISDSQNVWAELPGRYRFQTHSRMELPSVGDWVLCKYEETQNVALVEKVLARKSCMYRAAVGGNDAQILASNIDYAFILTSANIDFNIARLERYLSLVWDSGAIPVILITKAELAKNIDALAEELSSEIVGVDIHAVSVQESINMQVLEKYFQPGKSVVFVGSSGVGKSTLTNYLLQKEVLETQEIRKGDDRGKHTTTARHLFFLENGAIVIDTPGMRSLPMMDQDAGVEAQFSDLVELEIQCRFADCAHRTEPGCAVLGALESGILDEDRWKRYQKLRRELQRKEINEDPVKLRLEREKMKKRTKTMYEHIKMKRR
ncbi:ribosome small subunit-dependent GTPase A [Bdellovibrio sp. HCB337]|uniref:ribosome small subunit-dependent GTPase A n=1 Tax=Bdellovibrio sp. HCB337 TaxID=3394358 RepID=UPI0039A4D22E